MTEAIPREVVPLTERQMEIYAYIFNQTMRDGYQPSLKELMEVFGIRSPNGIVSQLAAMRRKGWIGPSDNAPRSLAFYVTPDGRPFKGFVCRED